MPHRGRTRQGKTRRKAGAFHGDLPMGFLSYARSDDEYSRGWISAMCKALSGEVRAQTGRQFPIFQDRTDVRWGQSWAQRVNGALETATFLFPVISPTFFIRKECRRELRDFLTHERDRKRNDLVFPVHFIRCKLIDQNVCRGALGPLVRAIKAHQGCDLIDLRFGKVQGVGVRKTLAKMAADVCDAIDRVKRGRPGAKR